MVTVAKFPTIPPDCHHRSIQAPLLQLGLCRRSIFWDSIPVSRRGLYVQPCRLFRADDDEKSKASSINFGNLKILEAFKSLISPNDNSIEKLEENLSRIALHLGRYIVTMMSTGVILSIGFNLSGGDSHMNDLIWYSWVGGIIIGSNMVLDEFSRAGPRNVVITGSTRGLGKALAREFLLSGDRVVIASRSKESVDMTIRELEENLQQGLTTKMSSSTKKLTHAKVIGTSCDVCDPNDVKKFANFAVDELGSIDIWINNAGTNKGFRPLLQFSDEDIQQIESTNLVGSILCTREAMRMMGNQHRGGHIFNMDGAGSGGSSTPLTAVYGSTKCGLRQLQSSLLKECKKSKVGVHTASPGMVLTDLLLRDERLILPKKQEQSEYNGFTNESTTIIIISPSQVKKMRVFLHCNSSSSPFSPPLPATTAHRPQKPLLATPQKPSFIRSLTGVALSFNLLFFSPLSPHPPPSIASDFSFSSSQVECREEDQRIEEERRLERAPELVTNEEIVKEAWEIVNDSFLGADRNRWSPQSWLQKKEDITGTSLQTRSKAHDVIRRMLSSLGDPYTRFLSPEEFSKMARYDMSGIGVNLKEIPDENGEVKLKVLGLILDGPAHAAGVRQGDELLSVNGVNVKGKSAFEALSVLQGPSDTSVNIMVKHGNCGPVQSVEVQRQLVAKTPVFYRLEQMDNGNTSVGYMRLKEFNALARKDLVTAMKRLQGMGASFFILDLRDNLGGLVQEGIEIAKLFLNEGETVIYTAGRETQNVKSIVADTMPLVTAPVIVLVNKNTASASEIVATALHDNCRAILVGEKTYGKGLIQSVFELHDGSGVVVTVGKYVTPNHLDINGNGIDPDYKRLPAWNEVIERLSKCQKQQSKET